MKPMAVFRERIGSFFLSISFRSSSSEGRVVVAAVFVSRCTTHHPIKIFSNANRFEIHHRHSTEVNLHPCTCVDLGAFSPGALSGDWWHQVIRPKNQMRFTQARAQAQPDRDHQNDSNAPHNRDHHGR